MRTFILLSSILFISTSHVLAKCPDEKTVGNILLKKIDSKLDKYIGKDVNRILQYGYFNKDFTNPPPEQLFSAEAFERKIRYVVTHLKLYHNISHDGDDICNYLTEDKVIVLTLRGNLKEK